MTTESTTLATIESGWRQSKAAIFFRRRPTEEMSRVSYACGAMLQLGIANRCDGAEGMLIVVIENGLYNEQYSARLANLAARTMRPTAVKQVSEWRSE